MQWLTHLSARLRACSDSGAVAVTFALCLFMLIGFVGLGVDVASARAKAQEVQNGADAAALAIAQSCAEDESDPLCSVGSDLAPDLAERNIRRGFDPTAMPPEVSFPEPNTVKVRVAATSENYFVALFGKDEFLVREDATAAWGSPTKLTTLLPLTIGTCEFNALLLDNPNVATVYFTKTSQEDCGNGTSGNPIPGGFGYIGDECSATVVDLNANGGWVPKREGSNPPQNCDMNALRTTIDNLGEVLIPVFDECTRHNAQPGDPDRCYKGAEAIPPVPEDSYHIVGFVALELHGVKFSGGGAWVYGVDIGSYCAGNERCVRGRFVRWVTLEEVEEWGNPPDFGLTTVRLID